MFVFTSKSWSEKIREFSSMEWTIKNAQRMRGLSIIYLLAAVILMRTPLIGLSIVLLLLSLIPLYLDVVSDKSSRLLSFARQVQCFWLLLYILYKSANENELASGESTDESNSAHDPDLTTKPSEKNHDSAQS